MFYLTTHSTHFIYGYMASDIWLRIILIVRKETCCRHIGYSYRLTARVLLYAPFHRQDNTYHGLCYTSREALAGTRSAHSKQAVVAHACHGHRYRPSPVPLFGTRRKKGGPPALEGTREYEQSNRNWYQAEGGLRCYGIWNVP